MQKVINLMDDVSIFTASKVLKPSRELEDIVNKNFPQLDLAQLFIDLNVVQRKIKIEKLESEFKKEFKDITRFSHKLINRKIRNRFRISGFDLIENNQIDLMSLRVHDQNNYKLVFNNLIKNFKIITKKGRPEEIILLHSIRKIDEHLNFYCKVSLKDYVRNSGRVSSPETRFHGLGIQLTEKILKQAKIDFISKRSLFDAIERL